MGDSEGKSGQFFTFPAPAVDRITREGGGVEELMALVILCRGAGRFSSSKWTENAISKHGGFTFRRAEKATAFLLRCQLLAPASLQSGHRYQLQQRDADRLIYLPNALVDGVGAGKEVPPLARLYDKIRIDIAGGINAAAARLDALVALLSLYLHQDIAEFGGVDPRVWRRPWPVIDEDHASGRPAVDHIQASSGAFYEIEKGDAVADIDAIDEVLPHVGADSRRHRYWFAISNLQALGFAYEVINVWDKPPERPGAALQYPLYVFDQRARESGNEPSMQREINRLAFNHQGAETFFESDGSHQFGSDVSTFRFVAVEGSGYAASSVLRLRYRAHDRETGQGMEAQRRMVDQWTEALRKLRQLAA